MTGSYLAITSAGAVMILADMRRLHYTKLLLAASILHAADADLVLRNGRLWTGDPQHPWAEALAIEGNRIVEVGTTTAIAKHAGAKTQVIDLGGRLAAPGFNDAHTHFLGGSLGLFEVNLFDAGSLEEMQRRIANYAKAH